MWLGPTMWVPQKRWILPGVGQITTNISGIEAAKRAPKLGIEEWFQCPKMTLSQTLGRLRNTSDLSSK